MQNKDYWAKAWDEFELWKEILASADILLAEFAKSHQMAYECWRHDTPSRFLSWREPTGLGKNIELFLEGMPGSFKLRISGSAWKDDLHTGRRKWRYETFSHLSVPIDQGELQKSLGAVYENMLAWGEADLNRTAKIARMSEDKR